MSAGERDADEQTPRTEPTGDQPDRQRSPVERADVSDESIPTGRLKRGGVAAKAGMKMGANYARYLARRSAGADKATARRSLHDSNARDLFSQLTRLRGTALKMAQGLSMDPGVLPKEFTDILAQAQYSVPSMGAALVRRLVKQELGQYPEDLFAQFSANASAAASLGQVHRAVLKDGRDVVVKVQYPNVRESVDSDLKMMRGLAGRFLPKASIDPYIAEVRERLMEETDYLNEGANIDFFAEQYAGQDIVTPRWVPELTTETVLTMTFVDGVHLKEYLSTDPSQEERDAYGQLMWDFVHEQIASDNLTVHADAHPGNFLFRRDGRLGVLDFGCVKRFPQDFRDNLLRLFQARMQDDDAALADAYEAVELLRPSQSAEAQEFLLEVLDEFGRLVAMPYRADTFDFSRGDLLEGMRKMMPRLTGREAFSHREAVGSRHFVFVNRLLMGLLSMVTHLGATVRTSGSRRILMAALD